MLFAKLSTDKTIVFGPVLDSTGAAVTSEVVASVKIMKNGAAAAALDAAATLTHSATGVYLLLLKAADISAVGEVTVVLNSGTNSASAVRLNVLPATVYDAIVTNAVNATGGLVGATAAITTMAGVIATTTNITAITGNITGNLSGAVGSVTGAVGSVTAAVTVGSINPDVVNASALAADAVAEIQSGLATPTNITAASGITVSSIGANVVNASALAADAVAEMQSGLATAANVSTVGAQVTAVQTVLSGITSLAHWLRRAFRKDAGSAGMIAAEAEIQTGGTATYVGTTDNLEAIKDAGGGGGSGDASQTTLLAVQVTTTAIAASLAGTPIEVAGRVASGGGITLYIGDDCKVASGTQLTITVSDPAGGLYTILNAIPIANLAWGASRARSAASLIPGTITSLAQSGSGASTLLLISVEIIAAGTASGCVAADDYEYQISSRTNTTDDFVRIEGKLNLLPRRVAIP